ncbi:MAG: hypothetical protein B6I26_04250 [Desulfobacteraceae bacterium 4572_130]|nr:MAG: hypothetical protein B6I26_04250 [Desulfobacteraceae bacterium 4572_130]
MKKFNIFPLKSVFYLYIGIFIIFVNIIWAYPPYNEHDDNSVKQVISHLKATEIYPGSIEFISWSPVVIITTGNYKVTVTFKSLNRFKRIVKKKQIIIMDETGKVLNVFNCR